MVGPLTHEQTGNTGLGYEIVKALYASPQPYEIIIGTRTVSNGEEAIQKLQSEVPASQSTLSVLQVDVTSDSSLEAAIQQIRSQYDRLDALVNNAGASFDLKITQPKDAGGLTLREAFNTSWDTNVSGTHVLTHLAAPLLLRSSDPRLVFMTSGSASLAETEPQHWGNSPHLPRLNASPAAGWPKDPARLEITSYRAAKTGLNMVMREWARILGNDGVKVWAVSPGMLATGLGGAGPDVLRKMGAVEPHVGGEFVRDVLLGKHDGNAGKAIMADHVQPW